MDPKFKDKNHAEIAPVVSENPRPMWSVLVPAFNCAAYLRETLDSVLCQDPGPDEMEIIVIDDHSTKDDPEQVVRECGGDRVRFIRQPENVGKVRNYETGLWQSRGRLIHQLHGDDRVRPGFYQTMRRLMDDNPEAGAGFCRSIYIDAEGKWLRITGPEQYDDGIVPHFIDRIAIGQRLQTPSMVVRRQVYEELGGFDRRLNCMEDWEMWTRIAAFYPVAFCNQVLAAYRVHDGNATALTLQNGSALVTQLKVLRIVDSYLDQSVLNRIKKLRARKQAEFLLLSAAALKRNNGACKGTANRCVLQALKFSQHPRVLLHAARLAPRLLR